MGKMQSRARSAHNKLAYILGGGVADFKAAADHLQETYGTRDPLALSDVDADKFAKSVQSAYGSFSVKTSPSDDDREPSIPSKDGSRKAVIDEFFVRDVYRRWNDKPHGVRILKVKDDK